MKDNQNHPGEYKFLISSLDEKTISYAKNIDAAEFKADMLVREHKKKFYVSEIKSIHKYQAESIKTIIT